MPYNHFADTCRYLRSLLQDAAEAHVFVAHVLQFRLFFWEKMEPYEYIYIYDMCIYKK